MHGKDALLRTAFVRGHWGFICRGESQSARCKESTVTLFASYLKGWVNTQLTAIRPLWALNLNSKEGQAFLATLPESIQRNTLGND